MALQMAWWCFDPVATALTGRRVFKPPYPGGSWSDEQQRNAVWLEAMETAVYADAVFSKDPEKWNDKDIHFIEWMTANA